MKTDNKIEGIIEFVMGSPNGIYDYNWAQDNFEDELRQTLLEFQKELREETIREVLPEKIINDISGFTDDNEIYKEPKDVWNYCRQQIISTAKEKYNINLR